MKGGVCVSMERYNSTVVGSSHLDFAWEGRKNSGISSGVGAKKDEHDWFALACKLKTVLKQVRESSAC